MADGSGKVGPAYHPGPPIFDCCDKTRAARCRADGMCAKSEDGKGCCFISGWLGGIYVLYCIYCKTIKGK